MIRTETMPEGVFVPFRDPGFFAGFIKVISAGLAARPPHPLGAPGREDGAGKFAMGHKPRLQGRGDVHETLYLLLPPRTLPWGDFQLPAFKTDLLPRQAPGFSVPESGEKLDSNGGKGPLGADEEELGAFRHGEDRGTGDARARHFHPGRGSDCNMSALHRMDKKSMTAHEGFPLVGIAAALFIYQ